MHECLIIFDTYHLMKYSFLDPIFLWKLFRTWAFSHSLFSSSEYYLYYSLPSLFYILYTIYIMKYNTWTEICFYLYHSFWLCEICLIEFIINLNNATTTKKSNWWPYTHPLIKYLYYFSLQHSENILGDRIKRIKEVNYGEKCDEKFT